MQLKTISIVLRTEGGDTQVTWSVAVVQLGTQRRHGPNRPRQFRALLRVAREQTRSLLLPGERLPNAV